MTIASPLYRLSSAVKPYAWGSETFIQQLIGAQIDGSPAAELWMGAHPASPSSVHPPGEDGAATELAELVAADPDAVLGAATVERFGPVLPYLLKVLAAERPLSIQAHPTVQQARAGCEAEDRRGLPRDSPERNYVDANHKPELICALTDFDALCGFRPVADSARLLHSLREHGAGKLEGFAERIAGDGGLRDVVTSLLTMPAPWQVELVQSVVPAAAALAAARGEFAAECGWTSALAEAYPGDPGVVLALLMNLVTLSPGQALFLSAGRIHAYLHGAGVELMASSDNVLRCGLTAKHIDPPELLRVLDFSTELVTPMNPAQDGPWALYPVPVEDFALSRLTLPAPPAPERPAVTLSASGAQVIFVTQGSFRLTTTGPDGESRLDLTQGQAAFIAATATAQVSGSGELFQASPNIGI